MKQYLNTIVVAISRVSSAYCGLAVMVFAVWFVGTANAAEITTGGSTIVVEGKIEPGDYDKLRDFLVVERGYGLGLGGASCSTTYLEGCPDGIYLASPGGDVAEAMKIGRLIRTLGWDAIIPSKETKFEFPLYRESLEDPKANRVCASACFFIFAGAINRGTSSIGDAAPMLGIHRPYLTPESLTALSGSQAITAANQTRAIVENYLKEMGVAAKYADQMFSVPKDEIRWIDDDSFEADFKGIIPELRDWFDAKCDTRTDAEKTIWNSIKNKRGNELTKAEKVMSDLLLKKFWQQEGCETKVKFELRKDAWQRWRKDALQNIENLCAARKSRLPGELATALAKAAPNQHSAAIALGLAQQAALCRDYEIRENAIRVLANRGDARAQRILGNLYYLGGYAVVKDRAEGMKWFGRAGSQGDQFAQKFYRGLVGKENSPNSVWTDEDYIEVGKWMTRNCPTLC